MSISNISTHKERLLFQFLSSNGDGSGTTNFIGDYTAGEAISYIQPPKGEHYLIGRFVIHIADSGAFKSSVYGADVALITGINIRISNRDGISHQITPLTEFIKHNADFGHYGNSEVSDFVSSDNSLHFYMDFYRVLGTHLHLSGNDGDKLEVALNDSFVNLGEHHFVSHGFISGVGH